MMRWLTVPAPAQLNFRKEVFFLDTVLLGFFAALLVIGYVMVVSASLHLGSNPSYYPLHQLAHITVGLVAAGLATRIRMDVWEKAGLMLFLAGLGFLVIVLIPGVGVHVNGSTRWLNLFGFRVQVSELFKLTTVIYLAGYITRHPERVRASVFRSLVTRPPEESLRAALINPVSLLIAGCLLLLMEPDFGSSGIVASISVGLFFLAGARLSIFATAALALVALGYKLVWTVDYRRERIEAFMDPWSNMYGSGWQMIQSMISFGRGETFGVGLGAGVQKMAFLPEAHNDFLLSVLAEELGLVGVVVVMLLFLLLILRAFAIGKAAELAGHTFAAYVSYGIGMWFAVQVTINMGVNMGVLPTKGLTLPLMSYGGASMVIMCAAVGLLMRINHENHQYQPAAPGGATWVHG